MHTYILRDCCTISVWLQLLYQQLCYLMMPNKINQLRLWTKRIQLCVMHNTVDIGFLLYYYISLFQSYHTDNLNGTEIVTIGLVSYLTLFMCSTVTLTKGATSRSVSERVLRTRQKTACKNFCTLLMICLLILQK